MKGINCEVGPYNVGRGIARAVRAAATDVGLVLVATVFLLICAVEALATEVEENRSHATRPVREAA